MNHAIISLFACFTVVLMSCSKAVITSSSRPERNAAPVAGPVSSSLSALGDMTPPSDSAPFERAPQVIKKARPRYPEVARQAGLEGRVWLKIWVDKTGKPKQIVVQKSSAEIFDEAAIAAAQQFVFTPAVLNGAPIDVWVMIPFDFKLK